MGQRCPAIYRRSYARPREDGRIHIATPARFVIEDDAVVEKLAAELDAGPVRETFAVLLKDNPVFAASGLPQAGSHMPTWRQSAIIKARTQGACT